MRETVLKLHFLRYFLLLVILLSFSAVSAAEPNLEKIKSLSKPFSELLILDQGRYKPLDSYAKTKLLQFSGKTSIKLDLSENKTRAGESPASKPINKTKKINYMEFKYLQRKYNLSLLNKFLFFLEPLLWFMIRLSDLILKK